MKRIHLFPAVLLLLCSCGEQTVSRAYSQPAPATEPVVNKIEQHYRHYATDSTASKSLGTVGNGTLEHGRIVPFSGKNFHYFDTTSYLSNRAFVHERVAQALLDAYRQLETTAPGIAFGLMECSNEHGGKIYPHRTHQNGLSVDFMTPLTENGRPCTTYDYLGAPHYLMEFTNDGAYTKAPAVHIDFETLAQHLLALHATAQENGLAIEKVILKIELQDELFATPSGKKLQQAGIYFTRSLTPLINSLHDDHYHVDFKLLQ